MYDINISRIIWSYHARKLYKHLQKIYNKVKWERFDLLSESEKDFYRAQAQRAFDVGYHPASYLT